MQHKNLAQELRLLAEQAKIALSSRETFTGAVAGQELSLTKEKLESLISSLVERTIDCCTRALKDAELTIGDIDEVVMVGGSTRVPMVKNTVITFFWKRVHD